MHLMPGVAAHTYLPQLVCLPIVLGVNQGNDLRQASASKYVAVKSLVLENSPSVVLDTAFPSHRCKNIFM
jgi:hypothetical protein